MDLHPGEKIRRFRDFISRPAGLLVVLIVLVAAIGFGTVAWKNHQASTLDQAGTDVSQQTKKINRTLHEVREVNRDNKRLLDRISDVATSNRAILKAIQSCTTPSGECSKRQRAASAAAVGSLNEYNSWLLWCSQQPENVTHEELTRCAVTNLTSD